jgi:hypothetical protein
MSMTSSQRNEIMRNVQQQVQMSQLQDIIQRTSHTCFEKCIGKPGTSLDNSEKVQRMAPAPAEADFFFLLCFWFPFFPPGSAL